MMIPRAASTTTVERRFRRFIRFCRRKLIPITDLEMEEMIRKKKRRRTKERNIDRKG
jgi:hypothetical protein